MRVLIGVLIGQWDVFVAHLPLLGPVLLLLNLLMLTIGLVVGYLLRLKKSQITSLAVEAGFPNRTIGIVVGSLISELLILGGLSRFSLPSAVYSFAISNDYSICSLEKKSLAGNIPSSHY